MRRIALVLLLLLAACKQSTPAKQTGGSDARPAATDAAGEGEPDEAGVRAGKRTGLETPTSTPEVATEELVRALIRGTTGWAKVVDPAVGLIELTSIPAADDRPAVAHVEHRCGVPLEQTLLAFAMGATESLDAPGLVYDVLCDNLGLAVNVPGVLSHAVCSISSPSDTGLQYDLVFAPDPKLGLRLIGVGTADPLTTEDALLDKFDEALGRFGARCP